MRQAVHSALVASVASMVDAAPKVRQMCASMAEAGLAPPGVLERVFQDRLDSALSRLVQDCDATTARAIHEAIRQRTSGGEIVPEAGGRLPGNGAQRPGASLVAGLAAADLEMPLEWGKSIGLQRAIHTALDSSAAKRLTAAFEELGETGQVQRLEHLSDAGTDHTWLWCLGPRDADRLSADEYVSSIHLRLGVPVMSDDRPCSYCGEAVLDVHGYHSLTCAGAEATRGHTAAKDKVLDLALKADPAAEAEPVSLIPARP